MAKTRLTNADREAIRDAILAHKFTPIEAGLRAEENALALQARAKAYGSYLKTMEAAPSGAFPEQANIDLNLGGRRLRIAFGADYTTRCRVFDAHAHGGYILSLPDGDEFGGKVLSWAERREAAKVARSELRGKLGGTLSAFTTFDDLVKAWPEAESFVRERWAMRPDYAANVPAIQLTDLTAALDLPPEVAEAA